LGLFKNQDFEIFLLIMVIAIISVPVMYLHADVSFTKTVNITNDTSGSFAVNQQISASGNNLYITWVNDTGTPTEIFVIASNDKGVTFSNIINASKTKSTANNPQINSTGTNVYLTWEDQAGSSPTDVYFSRSIDSGVTFDVTPTNLSETTGNSLIPSLSSTDSNVYVVWRESKTNSLEDILFSNSTDGGATFNANGGPFHLSANTATDVDVLDPQILSSGSNVAVAWHHQDLGLGGFDADFVSLSVSNNVGKFFQYNYTFPAGNINNNAHPRLAINGTNLYLVWSDGSGVSFKHSGDSGATFDATIELSTSGANTNPEITAWGDNVHVIWEESDRIKSVSSTDSGDTFGTVINIDADSSSSQNPKLISSGNNVHVVWKDNSQDSNGDIFFRSTIDNFSSQCGVTNISADSIRNLSPTITFFGSNVYVSWLNGTSNNEDVIVKIGTTQSTCLPLFNQTQYRTTDNALITISDTTADVSGSADPLSVKITSPTSTGGITVSFTETGATTGEFTGIITFTEDGTTSGSTLKVSPGETITAVNQNTASSGTATIYPRTVTFDFSSYTIGANATITVTDLNSNNTASAETITVSVTSPKGSTNIDLVETENKNGVFAKNTLFFYENDGLFPITGTVTVSVTETGGAPDTNSTGDTLNSGAIDTTEMNVDSPSDTTGITLKLIETSNDSKLFQKTLTFTTGASVPGTSLQVQAGEMIEFTYRLATSQALITPNSNSSITGLKVGTLDTFTATYKGVTSDAATLNFGPGAGGGGGGVVRPGLVLNAVAGIQAVFGGGGGSADRSPPASGIDKMIAYPSIDVPSHIQEQFENLDLSIPLSPQKIDGSFAYPLEINDDGYLLHSDENDIETKSVNIGEPIKITNNFYEQSAVEHASIYFNIQEGRDDLSDTFILFDRDENFEVVDRNGFFEDVKVYLIEDEKLFKKTMVYEIIFAKPMETSDIVYKMWDFDRRGTTMKVYDAIEVVDPTLLEEIPETYNSESVVDSTPPVPEWIKENVKWWADGQIEDSTFTAGIGYLIQEKIIDVEVLPNVSKDPDEKEEIQEEIIVSSVPEWIKNNAKWWADGLLSEDDFLNGIKYLVENKIITL